MLSYRFFITKISVWFASKALCQLIQSVTSERSPQSRQKVVNAARASFDMVRFWLRKNPLAPLQARVKRHQCWVSEYASEQGMSNDQVVILFHGGGFVVGGDASHGPFASDLAYTLGCRVYLVEYPLVPETQLKETIQVCSQVVDSIMDHDENKHYALMGTSAGGCIASQVVVRAITKNNQRPFALYLMGPVIQHCFNYDAKKYLDHCNTDELLGKSYHFLISNPENKARAVELLGGSQVTELLELPDEVIKEFPPTHITYQQGEVLSGEISAFSKRLRENQVSAVDNIVDNAFHSFNIYNYLPQTRRYIEEIRCHLMRAEAK